MICLVSDIPIETRSDEQDIVIRSCLPFPLQVLGIYCITNAISYIFYGWCELSLAS
jgi:hypothetical protein